jgi:hypothetical protein
MFGRQMSASQDSATNCLMEEMPLRCWSYCPRRSRCAVFIGEPVDDDYCRTAAESSVAQSHIA